MLKLYMQCGQKISKPRCSPLAAIILCSALVLACGGGGGESSASSAGGNGGNSPSGQAATGFLELDGGSLKYYAFYPEGTDHDVYWKPKKVFPLEDFEALYSTIRDSGNGLYVATQLKVWEHHWEFDDVKIIIFRIENGDLKIVKRLLAPVEYQYSEDYLGAEIATGVTVSPDVRHLAFAANETLSEGGDLIRSTNVYIMDIEGRQVHALAARSGPIWLDEHRILMSGSGKLVVFDINTKQEQQLGPDGLGAQLSKFPSRLALSPDRRSVAFLHGGSDSSIWLMDLKSQALKKLTDGTSDEAGSPLSWSPDGLHLGVQTGCLNTDGWGIAYNHKGMFLVSTSQTDQVVADAFEPKGRTPDCDGSVLTRIP